MFASLLITVGISGFLLVLSFILCIYQCCLRREVERQQGFKYVHYGSTKGDTSNQTECPICLEDFTPRLKITKCVCGHLYHIACLQTWIRRQHNCPLCKIPLCTEESSP